MGRFAAEPYLSPQPQTRPPSNGLGVAGFVVSLVGFFACPLVSVVGMIMSFIAMFREPRGLAIAGFVIGLLGSLVMLVVVLFFGAALVVFGSAISIAGFKGVEATGEMIDIGEAVAEHRQAMGSYPKSLESLSSLAADERTDPWGRPYEYSISADGSSFSLKTLGEDGVANTPDDILLDRIFIDNP
jgi:Type II secretion system (T2SS), protein G